MRIANKNIRKVIHIIFNNIVQLSEYYNFIYGVRDVCQNAAVISPIQDHYITKFAPERTLQVY